MEHKPPVLGRRLSATDAAFLYLERKEIPLNIACVAIFDGPIPYADFVAHIDSKLDLIPRYRQVIVPPALNFGYPVWGDARDFDIRRHIFRVRLEAPGGEAELEALAGRLLSQMLDRAKPLWELHVVEGLKDGRGALIVRVHHALADGVAGAALLEIMLDATPETSPAAQKPSRPTRRARNETGSLEHAMHSLTREVSGAIQGALESAIVAEAGLLSLADGLFSDQGKAALQQLGSLLPELLRPAERYSFNKPCSGDRKFCWTETDFEDVRAIRAALGGKVNDCVLSVVVRAISRYIRLRGEKVEGRLLRVVCPVNVRADDHGESMGNRITFLPVVLPLDVSDPVKMLQAVAHRMEVMKSVHAAELVAIAGAFLGATPAPVQELFWRGIPTIPLPFPLLNMICTNVPGSPTPLYLLGRRLLASYPQVPTGYELGIGVAVQSYAGKLCYGVIADAHVAPDANRLRDYIRESFEELAKAAGLRKTRAAAKPRRQTQARAKPTGRKGAARPHKPPETPRPPAAEQEPPAPSETDAPPAIEPEPAVA